MKISFKINDLIEVEYTDEKYQENLNENHNLVILVPENQEQIWRNIDNSEEVQQIGGVFVNQCKKYIDKQKSEDLDFNRYLQFAFSREIPKSLGFWSLYKDKTVKSFKSRTFIFSEIEKDFENMAINYHNLSTRLLYYNAIKDNFVKLWEIRSLNAESNELLVMLNQFIKNNNPENLNKKQLGILCNAINKLESNKIADEDLDEIFDDLIDSGMEFFPTIEGYSDRCEDWVVHLPSNVFLDNNICISWLLKEDPAIYNYVNDKVSESAAFISEYVLAEFIRTIVYDAIALLSILDDEIDLDGVKSRIYDIFENGNEHEQKAAERYIMLMNSIDFINGEDLDYAKIMIKFYARCSLKNLKKKIQILDSKLNCTLASKKPKREGLILKIEIPCESNINRANCSIMDYIKSEISFLNSIANGITGRSDFKKLNDLILTLNNCTLINCSLKHCKILGDVIILNDCPTDFIMVSKDHHFEKLCDITGHVLENF